MTKTEIVAKELFYSHVQGWDMGAMDHGGKPTAYDEDEAWGSILPATQESWRARAQSLLDKVQAAGGGA